jgi:thiol-disulfide isomerase/thioredoxin
MNKSSWCEKFIIIIFIFFSSSLAAISQKRTVIAGSFQSHKDLDSVEIYLDYDDSIADPSLRIKTVAVNNGEFAYVFSLKHPADFVVFVSSEKRFVISPGDSMHINFLSEPKDSCVLSGDGIDANRILKEALDSRKMVPKPSSVAFSNSQSLNDYLEFSVYIDSLVKAARTIFEKNKMLISGDLNSFMQAVVLSDFERYRISKFSSVVDMAPQLGLGYKELLQVYDSTIAKSEFNRMPVDDNWAYLEDYLRFAYIKSIVDFSKTKMFSKKSIGADSFKGRYLMAKELYSGFLRERVLAHILKISLKHVDVGDPDLDWYLKDYFSISQYPEYADHISKIARSLTNIEPGEPAPDLTLPTNTDKWIDIKDLTGKVVLLDFWFTGCSPCANLVPTLNKIHQKYVHQKDFVMINISIDTRKTWLNSLNKKIFTTGTGICAYTQGLGKNHNVIKNYHAGYPKLILIGRDGNIITANLSRKEAEMDSVIQKALAVNTVEHNNKLTNAPFVFYSKDSILINTIDKGIVVKRKFLKQEANKKKINVSISFDTHPEWNFTTQLKSSLIPEASVFKPSDKTLVLSDIEGEFGAFRKLLLQSKVMDEKSNWIFGTGQLVLVGDFFDRGDHVAEVLWLIYKLETEARNNGGYVHFILGNHDIMNLSGDYRYVKDKYFDIANLLGVTYFDLYGPETELGRWLRTKNIIEKVGDNLYLHAGLHSEVIKTNWSLDEINTKARANYNWAQLMDEQTDKEVGILFDGFTSPFWYRGYYKGDNASLIDSTLNRFSCKHIIAGHTIVADSITTFYDGKLINVDVPHAKGKSEALMIEGDQYSRFTLTGKTALPIKL